MENAGAGRRLSPGSPFVAGKQGKRELRGCWDGRSPLRGENDARTRGGTPPGHDPVATAKSSPSPLVLPDSKTIAAGVLAVAACRRRRGRGSSTATTKNKEPPLPSHARYERRRDYRGLLPQVRTVATPCCRYVAENGTRHNANALRRDVPQPLYFFERGEMPEGRGPLARTAAILRQIAPRCYAQLLRDGRCRFMNQLRSRGRRGPGRSLHAVVAKLAEPATTPELLLLRRRSWLEEPNHLKVPLCHHCIAVATENSTVAARDGEGEHGLTTEEGTPLGFAASASLRRNGEGRAAKPLRHLHRLALLAVNGRESSVGFHRRFAKPSRPAAATSRGGAKTMGKIVGGRGIEDRRRARPATIVVTYRRRRAYECSTSPPPLSPLLRSCSLLVARRSPWLTAAASRGRSRQLAVCDEGLRRRRRRMEAPGSCQSLHYATVRLLPSKTRTEDDKEGCCCRTPGYVDAVTLAGGRRSLGVASPCYCSLIQHAEKRNRPHPPLLLAERNCRAGEGEPPSSSAAAYRKWVAGVPSPPRCSSNCERLC
nr:hypothetical protein Iba_chr08eCG6440 [Ipomoea batatas]